VGRLEGLPVLLPRVPPVRHPAVGIGSGRLTTGDVAVRSLRGVEPEATRTKRSPRAREFTHHSSQPTAGLPRCARPGTTVLAPFTLAHKVIRAGGEGPRLFGIYPGVIEVIYPSSLGRVGAGRSSWPEAPSGGGLAPEPPHREAGGRHARAGSQGLLVLTEVGTQLNGLTGGASAKPGSRRGP
jgi:hypothetical protein